MDRQAQLHILTDEIVDKHNLTSDEAIDQHIVNSNYTIGDILFIPGHGAFVEDGFCMVIYRQNKETKKMCLSAMFGNSDDAAIDIPLCNQRVRNMLIDENVKFGYMLSQDIGQRYGEDILCGMNLNDPDVKNDVIEIYKRWGLY